MEMFKLIIILIIIKTANREFLFLFNFILNIYPIKTANHEFLFLFYFILNIYKYCIFVNVELNENPFRFSFSFFWERHIILLKN